MGLLHYLDYRLTKDVDAWWAEGITPEDRQRVIEVVEKTLSRWGTVRTRKWGDVVSMELMQEGKVVFSFQIARRSVQLEPCLRAPWVDVWIDSLADLVASKMVALVERGAPRDFRDIFAVCEAGLVTPQECWRLWKERQASAQGDVSPQRARLAVMTHLARIEQHRPLEEILDPGQREQAEAVRQWFKEEFLKALDAVA